MQVRQSAKRLCQALIKSFIVGPVIRNQNKKPVE